MINSISNNLIGINNNNSKAGISISVLKNSMEQSVETLTKIIEIPTQTFVQSSSSIDILV